MSKAWPTVRLGDVAAPVQRAEVPLAGTTYRQLGVKLWGVGAYEREVIDGSQTKYGQLFRAEADDIIVNKIWARNGSVAVVPPALAGCYGSGEFPMFAPNKERLDPRWMQWLTKTPGFWGQCDEKSQGTSGKNRIRPERFLDIEIPLPPLAEQRWVVGRIEELAEQIQEARLRREQAIAQSGVLMLSAAAQEYDEAVRTSEVRRLEELCFQITDGTHYTPRYVEAGIPFLSVKDISGGTICFDDVRYVSAEEHATLTKRCKPTRGDVLLTKIGTTGLAKVIDVDREFSIFVSLALLKPNPALLDPNFVEYMLNSTRLREHSANGTRGVGNQNLVLKFIREFPVPAPSLLEQRRIVDKLDALSARVASLRHEQAETAVELDALLPAILDRAFKGELV